MHDESSLLPLSALQHLRFCERRCALIHIEQVWATSNSPPKAISCTSTHEGPDESRPGVRITPGVAVRSFELGLSGQCDVVEFHLGSALAWGAEGRASRSIQAIIPLEYKHGKPKAHATDEVQLCAEEMLGVHIERGMLYYGKLLRRTYVPFHPPLQELTRENRTPSPCANRIARDPVPRSASAGEWSCVARLLHRIIPERRVFFRRTLTPQLIVCYSLLRHYALS